MEKTMICLRGVSGSGKTTLAECLAFLGEAANAEPVICCADDYHMVDGKYDFKSENLGKAHAYSKRLAYTACAEERKLVIIANTSTSTKDLLPYMNVANLFGYRFISLIVENRHGGTNVHSVPGEVLLKQENTLLNSIKLS